MSEDKIKEDKLKAASSFAGYKAEDLVGYLYFLGTGIIISGFILAAFYNLSVFPDASIFTWIISFIIVSSGIIGGLILYAAGRCIQHLGALVWVNLAPEERVTYFNVMPVYMPVHSQDVA